MNPTHDYKWDEPSVEQLRNGHARGMSAGQMAKLNWFPGCSRNAIIGKLNRLGLLRTGLRCMTIIHANAKPKRVPRPRPAQLPAVTDASGFPLLPSPDSRPVTLMELRFDSCRFPVGGDGAATLFCAATAREGRPYCPYHCGIAYRQGRYISQREAEIHRRHAIRNRHMQRMMLNAGGAG